MLLEIFACCFFCFVTGCGRKEFFFWNFLPEAEQETNSSAFPRIPKKS